jgi:hypothetical protein
MEGLVRSAEMMRSCRSQFSGRKTSRTPTSPRFTHHVHQDIRNHAHAEQMITPGIFQNSQEPFPRSAPLVGLVLNIRHARRILCPYKNRQNGVCDLLLNMIP